MRGYKPMAVPSESCTQAQGYQRPRIYPGYRVENWESQDIVNYDSTVLLTPRRAVRS